RDLSKSKRRDFTFTTFVTDSLPKNLNINFLGKRKIAYIISAVLVLISLVSLTTKGLEGGVDFVGGRSYQVRFVDPVNPTQIGDELSEVLGSTEVKTFGDANQVKITTKYKVDVEGSQVDEEIQHILYDNLSKYLPDGFSYEDFTAGASSSQIGILQAIK